MQIIKPSQLKSIRSYFTSKKEKPDFIESLPMNGYVSNNHHMNSVCGTLTVEDETLTVEPLRKKQEVLQLTVEADSCEAPSSKSTLVQ